MEPDILGALIDRHSAALRLFARQWCETPEDVVQEAFAKLATGRTAPADPSSWLFRVVRNGAINAGIASRRRRKHEARAASGSRWFEEENPASSTGSGLDPEAAEAALVSLPIAEREVIVAHLWGGLTFAQVGEMVGTSASSAHRTYQAGLSALRQRLGEPCREESTRSTPT